ncbi:hypothetical protein RT97_05065 [Variovorax paradoxus]|uniref:Diguanylate cyclase n=1 Tax=Variovorax paradoxus TaxID=34073 RepID=A0A0D0MX64_VARPD|nr:hypothetical protein [Variovorax paradoxus]KIQ35449.1 hypothetical protein RT97_05065 [Variovorax paradoxus]
MNILETIASHSDAMRLPLYAVTVTGVAQRADAALLSLHWHGFFRTTPLKMPGVQLASRPVAPSMARLDLTGERSDALEHALLEAAWQLGAWDLERVQRPAWWRLGVPAIEVTEALRAFGHVDDQAHPNEHAPEAVPDREDMLREAGRRGYVRWLFRPRKCGIWSMVSDDWDDTLDSSGGRSLPCPVVPLAMIEPMRQRTVYRLGRASKWLLSPR